jgi:hypothetical protein
MVAFVAVTASVAGCMCVFTKINPHAVCVACHVIKLVNFGAEKFILLGIYCLKFT